MIHNPWSRNSWYTDDIAFIKKTSKTAMSEDFSSDRGDLLLTWKIFLPAESQSSSRARSRFDSCLSTMAFGCSNISRLSVWCWETNIYYWYRVKLDSIWQDTSMLVKPPEQVAYPFRGVRGQEIDSLSTSISPTSPLARREIFSQTFILFVLQPSRIEPPSQANQWRCIGNRVQSGRGIGIWRRENITKSW